ncbi:hypothetical protein [Polyangium sp. y55x31]|uniref:hypothetical protein n=1 Tax=Polyangium sp. y55x31 TaxID=3042688 RepID=UPI00248305C6|nr:hypothetical protein [Polyangium sp. y55x31]MDI1475121.1 hypothetical protein [Polyangium sp. y55x31]
MKKKARVFVLALLAIVGLTLFAIALTRANVGLSGPHTTRASSATLDKPLEAAIEFKLREARLATVEEALELSLRLTGARLHFGLGHPTRLSFGAEEREGNCIEYAHLFARIFDMAAARSKLSARAYVVHSAQAEVFEKVVPLPGLRDHDWVVIEDDTPGEKKQWFVDPAFEDAWLGWDLTHNVKGDVKAGR